MYHMDPDVERTMVVLADLLCMWERETGRRSTFIFVPHEKDESIVRLEDGKPTPLTGPDDLLLALADAHARRPGSERTNPIILEAAARCVIQS
jgi:hypothetical protein